MPNTEQRPYPFMGLITPGNAVFTLEIRDPMCVLGPTLEEFLHNPEQQFFKPVKDQHLTDGERRDICLEAFTEDHRAVELVGSPRCQGHVFGKACIEEWFKTDNHTNCPTCRSVHIRYPRFVDPDPDSDEGSLLPLPVLREDWRRLVAQGAVPRDCKSIIFFLSYRHIAALDFVLTPHGIPAFIDLLWSALWLNEDSILVPPSSSQTVGVFENISTSMKATRDEMAEAERIDLKATGFRVPELPEVMRHAFIQQLDQAVQPALSWFCRSYRIITQLPLN
ncbi:hypothetical protein BU24DRAFT_469204 [Aaosphaeria arxii CBS 175.79]|uniref:RING-type domain-containing protein n=1 Tax=Aaosphaeria arxii CBS 175.79 TaxID=1450172 RepID=A0A6A5Y4J6_9PLEO|nr:uncharacterized protein BU24DRAFT_469204 [Aaosphaeria arxii CBS 175.79]KAF2020428.1 hypothetical protein BU24DRAFT_469204 [Aaosphaeria arxii CBS 175.79]